MKQATNLWQSNAPSRETLCTQQSRDEHPKWLSFKFLITSQAMATSCGCVDLLDNAVWSKLSPQSRIHGLPEESFHRTNEEADFELLSKIRNLRRVHMLIAEISDDVLLGQATVDN